ncbi:spore maturation protein [Rubrivirga marina]|uniref:Spore maturation protein n=1 Tax=Rubrivirga marina TaxID=1196024 RepID=A0A271J3Y4_9BACT|nr:spore maturation protein [Rubrivirga marina]PAP77409.1 spore maturation protein [Rubrivirga marina]
MDVFREFISAASVFVLPAMIVGIPLYGLFKKVPVYESFVEGGKEGFGLAVRIIPYLVAILFAIGMFRASGAMEALSSFLSPVLALIGMPAEVLPMAIVRPLTGSGSVAIVADLAARFGESSMITRMASTMFGSTETTFYVIAVYFGAVNVSKTRHALPAGLIADVAAMLLAVWMCLLFFGG